MIDTLFLLLPVAGIMPATGRKMNLSTMRRSHENDRMESWILDHLITPHGGTLVNLIVDGDRAAEIREHSREWPSIDLGQRQLCDLELLLGGGLSPLEGFMGSADFNAVCAEMRLTNGVLLAAAA